MRFRLFFNLVPMGGMRLYAFFRGMRTWVKNVTDQRLVHDDKTAEGLFPCRTRWTPLSLRWRRCVGVRTIARHLGERFAAAISAKVTLFVVSLTVCVGALYSSDWTYVQNTALAQSASTNGESMSSVPEARWIVPCVGDNTQENSRVQICRNVESASVNRSTQNGMVVSTSTAVSTEAIAPTDTIASANLVTSTNTAALADTTVLAEDSAFRERVEAFMAAHDAVRSENASHEIPPVKVKQKPQRPTIQLEGRIFTDMAAFSESDVARQQFPAENMLGFRSARIGVHGDIYDKWIYRLNMEFGRPADNGVVFAHCYLGVKDTAGFDRIMIGHNKEPLGLERSSSMQQGLFLENGLQLALMPSWNWGVMGQRALADEKMTFTIGAFADGTTEAVPTWEGNASGASLTTRLTAVPWYDETTGADFLHLGMGCSFRDINEHRKLNYRTQAESTYSPTVGGGAITGLGENGKASGIDTRTLFSTEFLGNRGPWSLQSEYCIDFLGADASFNTTAQPNAVRDGYIYAFYLAGSYFLTGEHRTYDRKTGTFGNITPNRYFLAAPDGEQTGWGAWQLAYRFSMIDYGDLYRQGHQNTPVDAYRQMLGKQVIDHTIGLNWYWNPYTRTMFDYIYTQSDANAPTNDASHGTADGSLHTFAMRFQVNW